MSTLAGRIDGSLKKKPRPAPPTVTVDGIALHQGMPAMHDPLSCPANEIVSFDHTELIVDS
jgi:hypothetical protein